MSSDQKQVKRKERSYRRYTVDFNSPVTGNLLSLESAQKYLESNIKVNGVKKNLGEAVRVGTSDKKDKQKNTVEIRVDNKMKFSKRYIKYLVKKFLKKENISLYLRTVASGPSSYVVKLFDRNTGTA